LYVDGFIYDFEFGSRPETGLRQELENMDLEALQAAAEDRGIHVAPQTLLNKRHLIRVIEREGQIPSRTRELAPGRLLIGMRINKDELDKRIAARVDTMFNKGLVEEVEKLVSLYGSDAPGLSAPGYKAVIDYMNGTTTLEEARERFTRYDRQLAKRQLTWFKRNKDINWCSGAEQALQLADDFLTKSGQV
jgi:tRNA dimethylallyltransferase